MNITKNLDFVYYDSENQPLKNVSSDAVSMLRTSDRNFRARSLYLATNQVNEIDNKKPTKEDNLSLFAEKNIHNSENKLFKQNLINKNNSKSMDITAMIKRSPEPKSDNQQFTIWKNECDNTTEDLYQQKQNFVNFVKKHELINLYL